MIKEYWFYLETYVFLWSDSHVILIYNTLSGHGYLYNNVPELTPVVTGLKDKSNLYCVTIKESDMNNPAIKEFIFSIRENFCGDLLDKSIHMQKPLVIIPELNVNEEAFTGIKTMKPDIASGIHAERNLLGLTVYLTGICNLDCKDCRHTYRQVPWCFKNNQVLRKEVLFDTLKQTVNTSLSEVKFFGGNVFSYPFWSELIDELRGYSFIKSFYINCQLLTPTLKQLRLFEECGFFLYVLVDVSNTMEKIIHEEISFDSKYKYLFKIKSIKEYEFAQSIIDRHQLESKIIPFYDGTNLQFFKENIFQNLNDIINTHWSKNEIFAHAVLNTNNFGKFTIFPDGKIHANINFGPIGDIKLDRMKVLVNQELKYGKSWLLTRDGVTPCRKCLYKYLCSSPSDYEIVIGQNNLCHVFY